MTAQSNSKIIVDKVSKKLNSKTILKNIDLEVHASEVVGIIGANGSGKTTLLRIIAGLIYPSKGEVYVNGKKIKPGFLGNIAASVGVLIEHPAFLPNFSGMENLMMLAEIQNKIQKKDVVEAMMKLGLDPDNRKPVKSYSLGMRQRLGIAQAIMEKPDVLLLDEPTNGLDSDGAEIFADVLQQQVDRGTAIVLISHHKDEIKQFCDQVYKIAEGTLSLFKEELGNKWLVIFENMSELETIYNHIPSLQLTDRINGYPTCIIEGAWNDDMELKEFIESNGIHVKEIRKTA